MAWPIAYMSLSREVTDLELQIALERIYQVDPSQVLVKRDPEMVWAENLENVLIACQIRTIRGDFPLSIEITPLKKDLISTDEHTVVGQICTALKCQAIIASNFYNPYV